MSDEAAEAPPAEEAAPPAEAAEGEAAPADGAEAAAEGEGGEAAPEGEAPPAEDEAPAGGDEGAAEAGEAAPGEKAPAEVAQEAGEEATAEEVEPQDGAEEGEIADAGEELPAGGVDSAMVDDDDEGEMSPRQREDEDDEGEAELRELEGEAGEEEDDEEPEDRVDPMVELQEKYDQLSELHERAMQNNVALQRRVIQRKAQDKSYDTSEKQSDGKVTDHKYYNVLHNVHSERLKLRLQQVKAARMSEELKNQLESKRQKAIECRDSFQEFKRQVAKHAEYARTGKKIQEKIIQEVEEFELDKDAEVEEVRGSNISLKNRLAKLEQDLRKKDELAENLHVIDFEQLKIENQTLNEKIEERNEELHKLRKKTIVTVQIITHMREKVQFVQQEYQVLKGELAQLEQALGAQRDLVAKTKSERDDHRTEYAKLKQQAGIMNSEHLTKDFESRAEHIRQLKEDISSLKKRHQQMTQFVKAHGGRI
eukprot:TRINITY_DN47242_c0_g1_i1.p1 TRINITY_DN47242_c0_g1~~TRINITY_DN47242_c0_g1_i1.p1  ORF type:complete len:481 (-),score=187.35 TRINITY_DN47242_c0_g1_i1:66-1508(-)